MQKQTKNVITREFIKNELLFYNTANLKFTFLLCVVLTLLFLPFTIGVVYGILSQFENMLIKITLSLAVGAITSAPAWVSFLGLYLTLSERRLLVRDDFDIITRDVLYKSEELIRRHIEEYLYFRDFNKISVEHTTFQLASAGDTFYIVHYKEKKDIKLLYSAKIYEIQ